MACPFVPAQLTPVVLGSLTDGRRPCRMMISMRITVGEPDVPQNEEVRNRHDRTRWSAMSIAFCLAGVMALLSFLAPSSLRFGTLTSSAAGSSAGGPLVLAGESPRLLTVDVRSMDGVSSGDVVFSTNQPGGEQPGLTVSAGNDGGASVSLPTGLETPDTTIEVPADRFTVVYTASGATATVRVSSAGGSVERSGVPVVMTGVYTPSRADLTWQLDTLPTGSTPSVWGIALWSGSAIILLVVMGLAIRGLRRQRLTTRLDWRVGSVVAIFWGAMALLLRANFDDGWILAQSRLFKDYGWFSMYWENAALPAPTGYLWEWAMGLVAGIVDYQYAMTRLLASATMWFLAWYLIDRALRSRGSTGASRIVAFASFAAVAAGIGMNVRPEFFTAFLASVVLLLATRPTAPFGTRGLIAAMLSGVAIGSHPAGWVVALPAAAVLMRDVRAVDGLRSRLLAILGGIAAAGASLAVVVTIDSSASVALPAIDFLSAGPLQGKNPFDELARVNDLAGMSPNFRMGLAIVLIGAALMLGWLLQPSESPDGFLILCAALSASGLALTTSKWAAHTAAIAPAVALVVGLAWPLLARTRTRALAIVVALSLTVVWSFRGDVSLGGEYGGHGSSLPGDQLFTGPEIAWKIALALLLVGAVLFAVVVASRKRRHVLLAVAAGWVILVPNLAVAGTSAVEVHRAGERWSLTSQHLKPTSDCGAAQAMPVFLDQSGTLADPTQLELTTVRGQATQRVSIGPSDADVAVWTSSVAPDDTRLRLVSQAGTVDFVRHPSLGSDYSIWTAPVSTGDRGAQVVVSSASEESLQWSQPMTGRVGFWGSEASGKKVLSAPFTILQIPCTRPAPLPLDTLTSTTPLVWTGDVFLSPPWWLPVRIAGPSAVFSVSAGEGPVGLNVAMVAPTDLAQEMRPATCRTGWFWLTLQGCEAAEVVDG